MKTRFNVNLGAMDAAKLDLDFKQCTIGAEVEVNDAAGRWLIERGVAVNVTPPKPTPVPAVEPTEVQAIPDDEAALEAATAPLSPAPSKKKNQ